MARCRRYMLSLFSLLLLWLYYEVDKRCGQAEPVLDHQKCNLVAGLWHQQLRVDLVTSPKGFSGSYIDRNLFLESFFFIALSCCVRFGVCRLCVIITGHRIRLFSKARKHSPTFNLQLLSLCKKRNSSAHSDWSSWHLADDASSTSMWAAVPILGWNTQFLVLIENRITRAVRDISRSFPHSLRLAVSHLSHTSFWYFTWSAVIVNVSCFQQHFGAFIPANRLGNVDTAHTLPAIWRFKHSVSLRAGFTNSRPTWMHMRCPVYSNNADAT